MSVYFKVIGHANYEYSIHFGIQDMMLRVVFCEIIDMIDNFGEFGNADYKYDIKSEICSINSKQSLLFEFKCIFICRICILLESS